MIQIPKIGLNQVVVEGTGEDDLSKGPGHYLGTPLPGEEGNVGIAGHRTTWGRPFYNLDSARRGRQDHLGHRARHLRLPGHPEPDRPTNRRRAC